MDKRICVYTCITGNYDDLKKPEIIEDNIDYYCFTNNRHIKSNEWKMIYIDDDSLSDALLSRKIKLLGHDEINGKYDIYLWMDSCLKIVKSVNDFVKKYCDFDKHDYFVFKHHARKNIKEEMQACLFYGKESLEHINKLKSFYEKENYQYENNLCENTIIIRNYSDVVQKTMNLWFDMLINYSGRDQLSFNYVASVTGLNYALIDLIVWNNEWFRAYNHYNKKDRFSIYFKQKENDGIYEYVDGDKIYLPTDVVSDKLKFEIHVPKKCNFIDIDISMLSNYVIVKSTINHKYNVLIDYINVYKYGNGIISKNNDSILRLSGSFKKNDKVNVCLELCDNKDDYINNYINELINEKNDLINNMNKTKSDYEYINGLYNQIVNSKRWKFINKFKK